MQIADPRVMTQTKRKLISREMVGQQGSAVSLETVNALALKFQLPQNEVRGFLVSCGYRIPEPPVHPRTDQDPIKKPAQGIATAAEAMPATAKLPVSTQVIDGILRGVIYKQLGEGDDAFVVTTKAQFVRERDALRKILMGGGLT